MDDWCSLGLWDYVDNKLKFYVGVGWSMKNLMPTLYGWQAGGPGVAGPSGYCYTVGNWNVYGRQLRNPVMARYQKYDKQSRQWIGRHRADD